MKKLVVGNWKIGGVELSGLDVVFLMWFSGFLSEEKFCGKLVARWLNFWGGEIAFFLWSGKKVWSQEKWMVVS